MNVRKAIRILQVYPLVIAVVFLSDILLDMAGVYITSILEPLFGVSLFQSLTMYVIAARMRVQRWSRILYLTITVVPLIGLISRTTNMELSTMLLGRTMFAVIATGTIASFITFIYTKYIQR